ncbi:DUF2062 domain-containing protein [Alkalimarinus alittae]|uniref:DUF2062 domain-containing protein n=1 Tax=Alkalimarinus alittae TaxID=2961619 RepID=A0ABY6N740_9ALTE|nr:DUF2062 domain-containing protein [Alkalimarinus alittae]UZE97948.1 DUF2062 domain-containing protein [Alkalimarinus alittae]
MPKRFLERFFPDPQKVKDIKALHFLGDVLHEPNLWHINRHAVSRAFLVGIFWCFIPIPFQMVVAAIFAIWLKSNLPMSVALVWISNPLTMPPIFYFNYWVGANILNRPLIGDEFVLSWAWLGDRIIEVGIPLYFGSLVCGLIFSITCYSLVQFFWTRAVRKNWQDRQMKRKNND